MKESHEFFSNKKCKYYPCHKGIDDINCLFCYCPLYHLEACPGDPSFREKGEKRIKVCTDCTFPHRAENYDEIIRLIRKG